MEGHLCSILLPLGVTVAWGNVGETTPLPYIILQQVSGMQDITSDGPDADEVARIQVDIYAATPLKARDTGKSVLAILNTYSGGPILSCFNLSNRALTRATDGNVIQRRSLDFAVTYRS